MLKAAACAGLLWWQQGLSDTVFSANSANGLIFFNLTFMAFRSLFVALFTFPAEQQMMIKARLCCLRLTEPPFSGGMGILILGVVLQVRGVPFI